MIIPIIMEPATGIYYEVTTIFYLFVRTSLSPSFNIAKVEKDQKSR